MRARVRDVLAEFFFRWIPRFPGISRRCLPGANLVGYARAELGLGVALRMLGRSMEHAGVPFLVRDIEFKLRSRQDDSSMDQFMESYCRRAVNVIGINPDLLYRLPTWLGYGELACRYNVGYWFYELSDFPQPWRYARHIVDEVWVNTDFVANAVRPFVASVVKMPFAVEFSVADQYDRAYFGLPQGRVLYLFSYDFNSSAARKNPDAVIAAFLEAFPEGDEPVTLLLKSINGEQFADARRALRDRLSDEPRIVFLDEYLTSEEMHGLLNSVDCYVSLHRSEGLGLGMAESMYLGKAVIATGYSGNLEFMNEENSCLVPYRLVPVLPGEYPHGAGQEWAEPDVSQAATMMRSLADDSALRERLGRNAAAFMREYHSLAVAGDAVAARLKVIDGLINA